MRVEAAGEGRARCQPFGGPETASDSKGLHCDRARLPRRHRPADPVVLFVGMCMVEMGCVHISLRVCVGGSSYPNHPSIGCWIVTNNGLDFAMEGRADLEPEQVLLGLLAGLRGVGVWSGPPGSCVRPSHRHTHSGPKKTKDRRALAHFRVFGDERRASCFFCFFAPS